MDAWLCKIKIKWIWKMMGNFWFTFKARSFELQKMQIRDKEFSF